MGELLGVFLGVLDEPTHGVLVAFELDQRCGLIEGDVVVGRDLARELALCDLDSCLDGGLLDAGLLGDLGDVEPFERQLLEHGGAFRLGQVGSVLVLGELLHEPGHGRVVAFHDVGRDGCPLGFPGGEHSALAHPNARGAVAAASADDGLQDSERSDAGHECRVDFDDRSHVRLDLNLGGVDVLDGAERGGVRHGSLSLIDCFCCRSGTEIVWEWRSRSAWSWNTAVSAAREDMPRKPGTKRAERTTVIEPEGQPGRL